MSGVLVISGWRLEGDATADPDTDQRDLSYLGRIFAPKRTKK
jgi:hypothetical protein